MADVRIIDLTQGVMGDNHNFESDDGNDSYQISATNLKAYCQTGLTPQSIGIPAGVTTTELGYLDGVTSLIQGQINNKAPINNPIFTGTVSGVTKAMVGLSNADNTSDINKPISTLQQTALDGKASTSIIIDTASGLTGGGSLVSNRTISLDVPSLTNKATPSSSDQVLIYDPVSLSHRRTTVSGITSGFSSGGGGVTAHNALTGLNADDHPQYSLANGTRWTATPTANRVAVSTASGVLAASNISTTELGYLSGVTSLIQSQLNNKTDSGHTHSIANIANLQTNLDSRALNSRIIATASGLTGGGDLSVDRTIELNIQALQSKANPSILDEVLIYDPVSLSHRKTTVSGIAGYSGGGGGVTAHGALTGLNADDHPHYSLANGTRWTTNQTANRVAISTASGHLSVSSITTTELGYLSGVTSLIQGQIDLKAPINNPAFTGTVSGVTKAMVGLNLVDNTSDINKPISTLQQAGLDLKAPINNPAFTGTVSGVTKAMVGLNLVDNTSDINKPISTLQQAGLDLKAPNSRVIATASGLTGGGDLSVDRTIALNLSALQSKTTPSILDEVLIYDPVSLSHKRTTVSGITGYSGGGGGVTAHGALTGLNADDHLQYSLADGTRWTVTPTANRVAISTASGVLASSSISTTELGYLSGVTSLIQGQIDNKLSNSRIIATASGLTGGGDLSVDRTIGLNISALQSKTTPSILDEVLIYDPVSLSHKKTTVSGITGYSGGGGGVTAHGALTGLDADDHPHYSLANGTRWAANQTANRVVIATASGVLSSSSVTTTELGYLSGVTSLIQAQIDGKTASGHTHSIADINNLQTDLSARVLTSRVIATASGLTGGGDLSTDRTIGLNIQALQSKAIPANVDQVLIYGISESAHRVTTVSGLTSGLQPLLVSEVTIKTINNQSVLGSGNLTITGGGSPSITTLIDAATVTPNVDATTIGILTSLSQNTTIANFIGTPVNYQELVLRITSSSIRRIFWGTSYAGLLPNTTSGGGIEDYFSFRFNSLDNRFDLVFTNQPSDEVELSYLASSLILTGNL